MKTYNKLLTMSLLMLGSLTAFGQQSNMQNFKYQDFTGLNIFDPIKTDVSDFNGLNVRIGGSFALQFQGIDHSNSATFSDNGEGANMNELVGIGNNFNLATANLDLDIQLAKGVRTHLRTYLSSRHHHEPYVKSGYLQIDRLDFGPS